MIVRPRPHWLRMLFVWRGSVLAAIAPQLGATTAFALAVTLAHGRIFEWKVPLTFVPFSLIGVTLAIFLGFRNNTAYARYWEARMLWGLVMFESRNLARQAVTQVDRRDLAPLFVYRLAAFAHALRHQLRGTRGATDFARLLPPEDCERLAAARFKPAQVLLMAGQWLGERRREGTLAPPLAQAMENHLGRLNEALAGCERIANTPIPFTYAVSIHRIIYIYCLLLPFGLLDAIGVMTPLVVAFIGYTFFALEALGAEIEEPFGTEPNDLPLDALAWTIEAAVRETLGETDLPPESPPINYVLT